MTHTRSKVSVAAARFRILPGRPKTPPRGMRAVAPLLRFLLIMALLCLPAAQASANHLHFVPITDSRYEPNTLNDLFGVDDLDRWIIVAGADLFSYIDDTDNIYSVSD